MIPDAGMCAPHRSPGVARCGSPPFDDGGRAELLDDVEFVAHVARKRGQVGDPVGQAVRVSASGPRRRSARRWSCCRCAPGARVAEYRQVQPIRGLVIAHQIFNARGTTCVRVHRPASYSGSDTAGGSGCRSRGVLISGRAISTRPRPHTATRRSVRTAMPGRWRRRWRQASTVRCATPRRRP